MDKFDLKDALTRAIVTFTFKKKNGEIREVRATRWLNPAVVGEDFDQHPKGTQTTPTPEHIIKFWDLEKRAWRSCDRDSVIDILKIESEVDMMGLSLEFK